MIQIEYTDFQKWRGTFCVDDYIDTFGPLNDELQNYRIAGAIVFDGEKTAFNAECFIDMAIDLDVPLIRIDFSNLSEDFAEPVMQAIEQKLKDVEAAGYEDLHSYAFSYCYGKKRK